LVHELFHLVLLAFIFVGGRLLFIISIFIVILARIVAFLLRCTLIVIFIDLLIVILSFAVRKELIAVFITILIAILVDIVFLIMLHTVFSGTLRLRLPNRLASICFDEADRRVFFLIFYWLLALGLRC